MKASEVATKLRVLADSLDHVPEAEISCYLNLSPLMGDKETFVSVARALPRPLKKTILYGDSEYSDFRLSGDGFFWTIPRSKFCKIIEPAKPAVYNCPPILSEEEEAALGTC